MQMRSASALFSFENFKEESKVALNIAIKTSQGKADWYLKASLNTLKV